MPRYQLNYVDEDDVLHPLGVPIEAPNGNTAEKELMDRYWDDRLDAASCSPRVTLACSPEHADCDESPCPYEVDQT